VKRVIIFILLIASSAGFAQSACSGTPVFVEKSDHDVDVAMINQVQQWGFWKLVGDKDEAVIFVRIRVSGNAAWGVGHVQAFVLDARTGKTIWASKVQKGLRTVFHGYASPYTRAVEGVVAQMKKQFVNSCADSTSAK
jgi:hypothetical protein